MKGDPSFADTLLPQATRYALAAADAVTPDMLTRPTPCSEWDLRMLLLHATESVSAIEQGLLAHRISLLPAPSVEADADPAQGFRRRVGRLIEVWANTEGRPFTIEVADRSLASPLLAAVAAVEIAVHGWDISQATGQRRPVPCSLAFELLVVSQELVPDGNRDSIFAAPLPVTGPAGPSERLLDYLGRRAG